MQNYLKLVIILIAAIENAKPQTVPGACMCVPTGTCNNNSGNAGTGGDGTGQIVRILCFFKTNLKNFELPIIISLTNCKTFIAIKFYFHLNFLENLQNIIDFYFNMKDIRIQTVSHFL